ncbi:hypothetical protein [Bradyrhizobium sp. 76]|uniref:hypothetical protein n=1 Tax=Bradyrhizobium sp. 76 TaxID=2782680 RepID=UPI001FFABCC1|nr:hypothetical protein [Bradyrhizobium sp. 76]MCK1408090.1 hypothetical protein [Bradyrhizobium sp. 76]
MTSRLTLAVVILAFFVCSVGSLMICGILFPTMHIGRSDSVPLQAVASVAAMAVFVPVFLAARFSFGYLVAFPIFSAVLSFVWLSFVSVFDYQHATARYSMVLALIAAITPPLFLNVDIPRPALSDRAMSRLIVLLVVASTAVLIADMSFGVAFGDPYGSSRGNVARPAWMNYLTGIVLGAVIPYLFAYFSIRKQWYFAICVAVLDLCFYPVVLNKSVLMLPAWLLFLFWLFGRFSPRLATVLSFLIPMIFGLLDAASLFVFPDHPFVVFSAINLRFSAVPALAIDHYADFFSRHTTTNFCQISFIRRLIECSYGELGVEMANVYRTGNFNASFLATEGIASVGLKLAPISALFCGLILAAGSMASRHLSPRFIAVSSGAAVPIITNVPLTTALLTNGVGLLFLLWWITSSPGRGLSLPDTKHR